MAASRRSTDPNPNVPEYEYQDVNTKPFHIGSFRAEWLKRLKPSDYSYQVEDEDTFDAKFAQELGVNAETMMELKSICNVDSLRCHADEETTDPEIVPSDSTLQTLIQRKERQDLKGSKKFFKNRHDLYADELVG
ncbi:unnamed protein product [Tetraodon nigroviridis]|uniref:(spotted green pufferfish) hypothetical protein n=1 Tax=Tetraodon nigroviridis TaxID=99883 RepID=Q4RJG7_TETNG|nr:unnamed protein product [Tetraodon nigroviridis]